MERLSRGEPKVALAAGSAGLGHWGERCLLALQQATVTSQSPRLLDAARKVTASGSPCRCSQLPLDHLPFLGFFGCVEQAFCFFWSRSEEVRLD